jgi:predicted membrane-bound dolichyl-phosphate-mannose-protein mannosyltransferase
VVLISSKILKSIAITGVFAYSLFNFFYNIDAESFYTDEVIYSQAGIEYLQGAFTRNLEHPFLGKYLIGLSLRLLGKSDLNARLPCALFGFLTGLVLCFFVKELTEPRRSRQQASPGESQRIAGAQSVPSNFYVGLIAIVLWSTSPLVLWVSRRAILDAFLVFFFTLSLFMFWRFLRSDKIKYALAGGISLGLALSCKLTAAVIFAILLAYLAVGERRIPKPATLSGLALALLIGSLILFASYAPMRDNLSQVFRVMGEHWSVEQRQGHRVIVGGMIYDKQPWWTYLYW